jgi:hypothetical protein
MGVHFMHQPTTKEKIAALLKAKRFAEETGNNAAYERIDRDLSKLYAIEHAEAQKGQAA